MKAIIRKLEGAIRENRILIFNCIENANARKLQARELITSVSIGEKVQLRLGHMYTCPTKQKLSTKCADLKRSLDSVGQTEFCHSEQLKGQSNCGTGDIAQSARAPVRIRKSMVEIHLSPHS